MKHINVLFSVLVLVLITTTAFGQRQPNTTKKDYQDSLKQLDLKRKTELANEYQAKLNIVNQYSSAIDLAIQNKTLVEHRLSMNANNRPIDGVGKYNRNVYFYYDNTQNNTLKKIIVFTIFGKERNDYQEFVFNEEEKVYKVNHTPDMSNGKTSRSFYYEDEKLTIYTKNGGKVYGIDGGNFDEDALQESVDWLNKAAGYSALFKLMRSIEPTTNE